MKRIAFAGGGSGGHCYPLITVAQELKKQFPAIDIYFVSTKGSIEERVLPKFEIPLFTIQSGRLNSQGIFKTFVSLLLIPLGFLKSIFLLLVRRPQLVMGAGGFAGAPFLFMAYCMGVPCAIFEQNRKPGLSNRLMARFASLIFVNFPQTSEFFPKKEVVAVGHPVREEIAKVRWQSDSNFGSDPFRILVFGGSQGALGINRLVVEALPFLNEYADKIQILHQTGSLSKQETEEGYKKFPKIRASVQEYIYDMDRALAESHLSINRAGASSIAELAAAGKASIFIPLVSKDRHQDPNAQCLADVNAGVIMHQTETTGKELAEKVIYFMHNRDELKIMAKKIESFYDSQSIAKIIKQLVHFLEK